MEPAKVGTLRRANGARDLTKLLENDLNNKSEEATGKPKLSSRAPGAVENAGAGDDVSAYREAAVVKTACGSLIAKESFDIAINEITRRLSEKLTSATDYKSIDSVLNFMHEIGIRFYDKPLKENLKLQQALHDVSRQLIDKIASGDCPSVEHLSHHLAGSILTKIILLSSENEPLPRNLEEHALASTVKSGRIEAIKHWAAGRPGGISIFDG